MTTHSSQRALPRTPAATATGVAGIFLRLASTWRARQIERRALERLDAHLLRDIGLDPETALGEIDKAFWQA